ncbi:uncharacterized protein LOC111831216 [Capsella rubella]|uniref:uncharacterized protein LOC111831216 n=1 Tax=Capsella rubella TaxID=81985 RepID=UPI000CD4B1F8|nr:uncharacterized protein LOC111831216 [Capsella rubella]
MSAFELLKLNIHFGGDVSFKDEKFAYIRGTEEKDVLMDPDLMTWSIFDEFCSEKGVYGVVEEVWYKLPEEDIALVRVIKEDKDSGIRKLYSEASTGGEVDIYIQQGVSEPIPFPLSQPGEECVLEEEDDRAEEVEEEGDVDEAAAADFVLQL